MPLLGKEVGQHEARFDFSVEMRSVSQTVINSLDALL
jgi:hypothetical protein